MAGVAFSEAIPFLSLYIGSLGNYSHNQTAFYTGLAYSASYIVVIITSPLWGQLADRTGRKPMMVRTAFGMACVLCLIGFATNVWQVIALRAAQGVFDGYTPSATALIAAETPIEDRAEAISKLSTGYITGGLLGPILGGLLGNLLNYRAIFIVTSFILFSVSFLSQFGITERFKKPSSLSKPKNKSKVMISFFPTSILLLLGLSLLLQLVESLITPFISLIVKTLIINQHYLTLLAGIIAALPGLATALFATSMSKLAGKTGEIKLLRIMDILAVITYFCLGLTHYLILFALFRFICGVCNAALMPFTQVLMSRSTSKVSLAFSWGLSAQSMGSLIGSMAGGVILQTFSIKVLFMTASVLMLIGYFLIILIKEK